MPAKKKTVNIDFKSIALAGAGGVAAGFIKKALTAPKAGETEPRMNPVLVDGIVTALGAAAGMISKTYEPLGYGMIGQGVSGMLTSTGILNNPNRLGGGLNNPNRIGGGVRRKNPKSATLIMDKVSMNNPFATPMYNSNSNSL